MIFPYTECQHWEVGTAAYSLTWRNNTWVDDSDGFHSSLASFFPLCEDTEFVCCTISTRDLLQNQRQVPTLHLTPESGRENSGPLTPHTHPHCLSCFLDGVRCEDLCALCGEVFFWLSSNCSPGGAQSEKKVFFFLSCCSRCCIFIVSLMLPILTCLPQFDVFVMYVWLNGSNFRCRQCSDK